MLTAPHIISAPARDHSSRAGQPIKMIVLHATAGTNSLEWLKGNSRGTSIHVLIRKDGLSYKMVDESRSAHHVGFSRFVDRGVVYSRFGPYTCNMITLGIELENTNSGKDPYPEAQLRAAAWWIQEWRKRFGNLPVVMHRDIDTQGKSDAAGIQVADVLRFIAADPGPVTPQSNILADERAGLGQAIKYITARGADKSYTDFDVGVIAKYYWDWGVKTGVDPCIAIAQMIHETGNLTSWWSLRPRRNPAGIGVTGERKFGLTRPGADWQWNASTIRWQRGFAFADWELAVKAHLGHLLLYALGPRTMPSEAQAICLQADPRRVGFPVNYRGSAPQLIGLNGKWAVPGTHYADAISAIANAIGRT
jgi:hypothetical protein